MGIHFKYKKLFVFCIDRIFTRARRGFTLIELLVVIAILAVISTIGMVTYNGLTKGAKDARRKNDVNEIAKALEANFSNGMYYSLTGSNFGGGSIPEKPEGGNYDLVFSVANDAFRVCAALETNPSGSCTAPAPDCFCKYSSQGGSLAMAVFPSPSPGSPAPSAAGSPSPSGSMVSVPFNPNSIWNKKIPPNPPLVSNSAQMISLLTSNVDRRQFTLSGVNELWSVPVYEASPSDPKYTWTDIFGFTISNVPVPSSVLIPATADDSDKKIAIIDRSVSPARSYSFWQFEKLVPGPGFTSGSTGWGDLSVNGDGIHNFDGGTWGGRATGWNYYAGLVTPEEIRQGRIDHALIISIDGAVVKPASGKIWPALDGDGYSADPNAIPEGSRFQLDPGINVDSLPLTPGGKVVAKALQDYGAWVGDTGGSTALYFQEFLYLDGLGNVRLDTAPWAGLLTDGFIDLPVSLQLVENLRVVQTNRADFYENATPPAVSPAPSPSGGPGPSPSPGGGNLATNPGFEAGTTDWIDNGSGTLTAAAGGHSGSFAGQMSSSGAGWYAVSWRGIPNPLQGTNYTISIWVKGSGASIGKQANLFVNEIDSTWDSQWAGGAPGMTLSNSWQEISFTHTVTKPNLIFLEVFISPDDAAAAGETFLLDDLSVTSP